MHGNSWNTLLSAKEESLIQNRADKIAAEENYQVGLDCYSKTRRWLVELDKLIHSIIPYTQGSRSSKLI